MRARLDRDRHREHDPEPEKQPQRVAPHRDHAAPAERPPWQAAVDGRPERQQRDDAAVERIGRDALRPCPRGRGQNSADGDQQRGQQEAQLTDREGRRMQDVVDQPARRRRAGAGIGEGQEIVLHQPNQMRRHDRQRDDGGNPGPGVRSDLRASRSISRNSASGAASTTTKYFAHSESPIAMPSRHQCSIRPVLERGVEGIAGQRPERQLDDVVIELGRRVLEVVQAVDDQDRDQRAARADQRQRRHPDQREGGDDRGLRQRVVGSVGAEHPVRRPRSATTAAAAACRSRVAIRGRRSAPRSGRAAGSDRAPPAARSRPPGEGPGTARTPPSDGRRPPPSIQASLQHAAVRLSSAAL